MPLYAWVEKYIRHIISQIINCRYKSNYAVNVQVTSLYIAFTDMAAGQYATYTYIFIYWETLFYLSSINHFYNKFIGAYISYVYFTLYTTEHIFLSLYIYGTTYVYRGDMKKKIFSYFYFFSVNIILFKRAWNDMYRCGVWWVKKKLCGDNMTMLSQKYRIYTGENEKERDILMCLHQKWQWRKKVYIYFLVA